MKSSALGFVALFTGSLPVLQAGFVSQLLILFGVSLAAAAPSAQGCLLHLPGTF